MSRLFFICLVLVLLSACKQSAPTSTPPTVTAEAVKNVRFEVIMRKYCEAKKIKLLDGYSYEADKELSIEVAAMEGDTTQATAEVAMGLMVGVMGISSGITKSPSILHVAFQETATGINKRLTLSDPALSDFLAGKISEDQLVKQIQIEVKQ
jgi:hypothetical protein